MIYLYLYVYLYLQRISMQERYVNINNLPILIRIPIHQRGLSLLKHDYFDVKLFKGIFNAIMRVVSLLSINCILDQRLLILSPPTDTIVVTTAASVRGPKEILFWKINNFAKKLLKFKCALKRSQNENANPLLILRVLMFLRSTSNESEKSRS